MSALAVLGCLSLGARPAQAQGFSGTLTYTGSLGPVNSDRPLCLCLFHDANLTQRWGCFITSNATTPYQANTFDLEDYYLVAFLDFHRNERVDPDEPFEIYNNRGMPPGDVVTSGTNVTGIDLIFGDENVPPAVTPTQTDTPTATPTATPSPVPCVADCDNSGAVTIDELMLLLGRSLGGVPSSSCAIADADSSGVIDIDELVAAVHSATAGCTIPSPTPLPFVGEGQLRTR